MDKERKLGLRVFYYYLSRRLIFGFALIIFSIVCLLIKESVLVKILFFLETETALGVISTFITVIFLASIAFLLGGIILAWIKYSSCTFVLNDFAISIKRGVLNKKEISIPYRQIQNVNLEQSFTDRIMRICKLIIQTAGNDESKEEGEGVFEVIDLKIAEEIQTILLQKNNNVDTNSNTKSQNEITPNTEITI